MCIRDRGKFEILGSFDEPVHVLKEFFLTDTGVHLSGGNIGMPQHPTDGLNLSLIHISGVLLKNNVIILTLNLKFRCLIFGLLGTINSVCSFKSNFKVYPLKCS